MHGTFCFLTSQTPTVTSMSDTSKKIVSCPHILRADKMIYVIVLSVHIVSSILNECHCHLSLMGAFKSPNPAILKIGHEYSTTCKKPSLLGKQHSTNNTSQTSQRKPTAGQTCTDVHAHAPKPSAIGPFKMQGTVEQWVCWFRVESAGPGKACTFSGFDYRGFKSLLHTNTHKDAHEYTSWNADTHSLPRDYKARLNYRPPDRAYLLKNGGLLAKDSFCC